MSVQTSSGIVLHRFSKRFGMMMPTLMERSDIKEEDILLIDGRRVVKTDGGERFFRLKGSIDGPVYVREDDCKF